MSNLTFAADAPQWMHIAADVLLVTHITGGTVGMLSGAVALATRKGDTWHRAAGNIFFVSMFAMAAVGAGVAPFLDEGQRPNTVAGLMALYMIVTAWIAGKRERIGAGPAEVAGFMIATLIAAAGAIFAIQGASDPSGTVDGSPPQAFIAFMAIGTIAALSDLKVILTGGLSGAGRIARHLWRMCTALFIAAGSFFLGQQKFLPEEIRGTLLQFAPVLLPLILMLFWLARVRLTKWYTPTTTAHAANAETTREYPTR